MAATTTTGSLADSKQFIIDSAKIVREDVGVYKRTTDFERLEPNTGMAWDEISLGQLTAQTITETTDLNNPQEITDDLLTITPTMIGIEICITDRVYRRMAKKTIAKIGPLAQNAIERRNDEDYIDIFATAATTLSGTGTTLSHGVIAAAASRIRSNTTERSVGPIHAVLHGFQIKDLADEIRAGVGTYVITDGMTEDVYKRGFMGSTIDGVNIWEAGNIAIDATPDARGAVHAKEAVIYVQGKGAWTEEQRKPGFGGGADDMFYYDEKGIGERNAGGGNSGGGWMFGVLSDATAPTS